MKVWDSNMKEINSEHMWIVLKESIKQYVREVCGVTVVKYMKMNAWRNNTVKKQ